MKLKLAEWYSRSKTFLVEVKAEWSKVTRPGRRDVTTTTIVVVVTSFIFAVYLYVADIVILRLYKGLMGVLGL